MHAPIIALLSADPSSRTALEQALSDEAATLLVAETTEAGLRLLAERRDLALIICAESAGRIPPSPVLALPSRTNIHVPVIVLGESHTAGAALKAIRQAA